VSSQVSRSIAVVLAMLGAVAGAQNIQIMSPASGTVVHPGQTVPVSVSTDPNAFAAVAVLINTDFDTNEGVLTAAPYQFTFSIPANSPVGTYTLVALGGSSSGVQVTSAPVTIDIERADAPANIAVDVHRLELPLGGQSSIRVIGTYNDGSVLTLNRSTLTTFVSQSPAVVTVNSEGVVTAIAPGATAILVNGTISVPVIVDPPITINPTQVTLTASGSSSLVARVTTHQENPAVTWQLNPPVGAIASDGTTDKFSALVEQVFNLRPIVNRPLG